MDTRFSSAIHTLIMIAGADKPLSSEMIAKSVGTNASYIRKITGLLKKAGIIKSRQGVGGFQLEVETKDLSLYTIYRAVSETERFHVFDLHKNPNDECIVGKHIQTVLSGVFLSVEEKAEQELKNSTLADCIEKMKYEIEREILLFS